MENQKYYIITPTFIGHYRYVDKYLMSFCKYVADPESVRICLIISETEQASFEQLVKKYPKADVQIVLFEDILEHFNIADDATGIIKKYGKFTFQTLKKLLAILYLNAEKSLILDSESMWINPCNMKKLFENYFSNPFLTVSNVETKHWDYFSQQVMFNIKYIFNKELKYWPLENFIWFYDLNILKNLFKEYGSIIEMAEKVYNKTKQSPWQAGIFEIVLYQEYILNNLDRYNYNIVHIDQELQSAMPAKEFRALVRDVENRYGCGGGLAEHLSECVNEKNRELLAQIFKNTNQFIIRCDSSMFKFAYTNEKPFMDYVHPYILAASQDHYFGINENRWLMLKNGIANKLKIVFSTIHNKLLSLNPVITRINRLEYSFWEFRRMWEKEQYKEFLEQEWEKE